jgi:hypothetical protein
MTKITNYLRNPNSPAPKKRALPKNHAPRNGRQMPLASPVGEKSLQKTLQSCSGQVISQLSTISGIEALFLHIDYDGVVHVYSVVADYSFGLYRELLKRERMVEKKLPTIRFDFHVRAHQGREPVRAVPLGARPLFMR